MTSTARVALACWRLAWMSQLGRRASFYVQAGMMVVNDIVWLGFWLLVFSQHDDIRGWSRDDVLVLFAVVTASFGIALGAFNGVRRIGEGIRFGEIDAYLGQPRPVLLRVLFGHVQPISLGDIAFGAVLFAVAGPGSVGAWGRYLLVVALSAVIAVSFILAWESLVLYAPSGSQAARVAYNAIMIMSTYPASIFGGAAKLLVYGIIPAAFVGSVPAQFVLEPQARDIAMLAAVAAGSLAIAVAVFQLGLRRRMRAA